MKMKAILMSLLLLLALNVKSEQLDERGHNKSYISSSTYGQTITINGPDTVTTHNLVVAGYPYLSLGLYVSAAAGDTVDSAVIVSSINKETYKRTKDRLGSIAYSKIGNGLIDGNDSTNYSIALPPVYDIKIMFYVSQTDTVDIKIPYFMGP